MLTPEREAELLAVIARLETENKLLREKIDLLVRRVFGSSSEKLDAAQLEMLLGEPGGKAPAPTGDAVGEARSRCCKARREPRARLPEHLPVEEEVLDPLEVRADPGAWKRIGQEVTEQLDYHPPRYVRRRLVRPRYVRRDDKRRPPVIAPLPPQLAEKLLATPAMIAHVITAKYVDHLPLCRQADILARRHGIPLGRQTLDGWVLLAADRLRLVYEQVLREVLGADVLQVDETPIRYLDPGGGRCGTGYLWTVHQPRPPNRVRGPTFYQWHPSRATRCLEQVLPQDYAGWLQCDGYAAYGAHAADKDITLVACWAHARRKVFEALEYDRRLALVLVLIRHLYHIEERLRQARAGPALRQALRQAEARPLLARILCRVRWLKTRGRLLPQSAAGKAIDYILGLWEALGHYVDDGRLEIDNNRVENDIRPTALGKKNWLFIGAETAGQASAILFTLVQECRRLGLNPQDYFSLALSRIPSATNHTAHLLTPQTLAPLLRASSRPHAAQAA
jgi:transposase